MKSLFILFAIVLLCNSQGLPSGYSLLSSADQNSSLVQSLAQFGADNVIQGANNDGNLPNADTNFTISSINSVAQQASSNGVNYLFNETLVNANNGIVLNAIFTVLYNPTTQAQRMVSASYNILPHLPIEPLVSNTTNSSQLIGGYNLLNASEVENSSLIQQLAAIGAQNVVQLVTSDGNLPSSAPFTIASINSVSEQLVNGNNYKFNVTLNNTNGEIIYGNYVINYQPLTNQAQVTSTSYSIPARAFQIVQDASSNLTNATSSISNPTADAASSSIDNLTNASVEAIDNTTNESVAFNASEALVVDVVPPVVAPLVLPEVITVAEAPAPVLANETGYILTYPEVFTVTEAVAPEPAAPEETTPVLANETGYTITYPVAIAPVEATPVLANETGYTITYPVAIAPEAVAPIVDNVPSSAPQVITIISNNSNTASSVAATSAQAAAPAQEAAPVQAASSAGAQLVGGYSVLSNSEINNNSLIQSLADIGARNVSGLVLASGKVPSNSLFTVSKINTVATQVVNGINYKFNVLLANADKSIRVAADYIVYYQPSSNTARVSEAAYGIMPN